MGIRSVFHSILDPPSDLVYIKLLNKWICSTLNPITLFTAFLVLPEVSFMHQMIDNHAELT